MDDKKSPGKPVPTSASTQQLLDHYNAQCEPYNAVVREKFHGDDEKIAELLYNKGRGLREKAGEVDGAESGNVASGRSPGGKSDDALLLDPNTPIATVNAILARRNGQ